MTYPNLDCGLCIQHAWLAACDMSVSVDEQQGLICNAFKVITTKLIVTSVS